MYISKMADAESAGSLSLALYVITLAERVARRCYQRTVIYALMAHATSLSLILRYISSRDEVHSALIKDENATHGDLIIAPLGETSTMCFHKVIFALGHAAAAQPDFIVIADDDAFIHPPRLAQDLWPLRSHARAHNVLYGYANFLTGWRRSSEFQFGFGLYGTHAHRLWRQWRPLRKVADGPFPFVYGFCAVLSLGLARHLSTSSAVAAFLAKPRTAPTKPRYASVCDPTSDGALGWALSHLDPPVGGVTLVDIVYANRMQLMWSESSEIELRQRTAVLHRADRWEARFRAALCASALPSRKRFDRATIVRCRGRDAPSLSCGAMGCRGPATIVYPDSECAREPGCAAYYNTTFGSWRYCVAVGTRRVPRLVLPNNGSGICDADSTSVLRQCASLSAATATKAAPHLAVSVATDAPLSRPRLAVLALSAEGQRHAAMRCYQREAIRSLAAATPGGDESASTRGAWMDVTGGGSVLLRFLVPEGADGIDAERRVHHDLLTLLQPISDTGPATCAARLLEGLRSLVNAESTHDFIMITDDDVWISPPRLLLDLHSLLDQPQHVLYGPIAFAAGWSDGRPSRHIGHHGWAPHSNVEAWLPRHVPRRPRRRRSRSIGSGGEHRPFPFLMGYCAVLSSGLAKELAQSVSLQGLVTQLVATAHTRTPPSHLPPGKCYPGTDVALGWALAMLAPSRPLLAIDVTYANRVLPWAGWQSALEVSRRAAIVHNATEWETLQWALCLSTGAIAEEGRTSKRPRNEVAPIMRCRGPAAPAVRCGAMRCDGPAAMLHNGSACANDPACAGYFTTSFANWTFCIAVGSRRVKRTALPAVRRWDVCTASREAVMDRCRAPPSQIR